MYTSPVSRDGLFWVGNPTLELAVQPTSLLSSLTPSIISHASLTIPPSPVYTSPVSGDRLGRRKGGREEHGNWGGKKEIT